MPGRVTKMFLNLPIFHLLVVVLIKLLPSTSMLIALCISEPLVYVTRVRTCPFIMLSDAQNPRN